jgi:hypothetical protein
MRKNIELKQNLAVFSYVKQNFALFRFKAKISEVKRSENKQKEAKK